MVGYSASRLTHPTIQREASMPKISIKTKTRARRTAAVRKPTARSKPRTVARAATRPKQRFVVSHHREEDFDAALRRYAEYRDLGTAGAPSGMGRAATVRF